jgi:uncharacterized protein (DUF4415 family)
MKDEYDFSKARKGKKAKELKVSKTFRLNPEIIEWLEEQGDRQGMGYQTFLNWFLLQAMQPDQDIVERLKRLEDAVFTKKAR